MRTLLQKMIQSPLAVLLVVVLVSLAGIYSAGHMPVDLFPKLEIPVVNIVSHYPGASPEDIERLISRPIENEMRSIPGVQRVASTSIQGISQVTAAFNWNTSVQDAQQLVQARLSRIAATLPPGVFPRLENIGTTLQEVCGYVVYADGDPAALRSLVQYDLAGRLMGVSGVSSVEVLGGEKRAFYIELKPESLRMLHLTVKDVVEMLRSRNVAAVTGFYEKGGQEFTVRGDARFQSLEDLKVLPLTEPGKPPVLLGDVARVYAGYAPKHYTVRGDARPAVAFIVRKQPGTSTLKVVRGVKAELKTLTPLLPPNTQVKNFYDQSEIIQSSQDEILRDLVIGALLAVFVLYFFMGSLRPTLVVALTVPVTFLATLAIMGGLGLTLNVITMTALALAIGMIVDDAIVVAENIFRHAHKTNHPAEASIEGTLEVLGADASGTFTTIIAFFPLVLVSGIAALFMRPFGLTISVALLVSLLLSLTLVPTLFGRMKGVANLRSNFPGARVLHRIDIALQSLLKKAFRHRVWVLILAFMSLGLAGISAFLGKASILPPIDEGAILIEYVLPPGTSLNESNRIGDLLDREALADPDVACVYRRTGAPRQGYQIESVDHGELLVKLRKSRKRSADNILDSLRSIYSNLPGVVFMYHQPTQEKIDESFSGLPALFGVTIYGSNTDKLIDLAAKVEAKLTQNPHISNVVNNTKIKIPQVNVQINYPALAQYGVAVDDILATLKAARFGIEATQIARQKETIGIFVRLANEAPFNFERIQQLLIPSANGSFLPLEKVAKIQIIHTPSAITRLNGQRQTTLLAEVEGSIPSVIKNLRKQFKTISLPEGYSIDFTGQYHVLMKTASELLFTILSAIALIYLVMILQFGSWRQPLAILAAVPFSLIGALLALFIMQQGIDISVGMGLVTLVGISVNNAIVLVDFSNREQKAGKSLRESLLSAASIRLRPILLTTLTTMAALLPVVFGSPAGSQIFKPFAITLIGGLISGSMASLLLIPVLLSFTKDSSDP